MLVPVLFVPKVARREWVHSAVPTCKFLPCSTSANRPSSREGACQPRRHPAGLGLPAPCAPLLPVCFPHSELCSPPSAETGNCSFLLCGAPLHPHLLLGSFPESRITETERGLVCSGRYRPLTLRKSFPSPRGSPLGSWDPPPPFSPARH